MCRRPAAPADEQGAATVLVAVLAAVVLGAAVAGVALAGVATAHARASTAADFAALAAVTRADTGAVACREAERVTSANGGVLVSCTARGGVASVRVSVRLRGWLSRLGAVFADARAGRLGARGDW
ncbi:MAG: Rv3654c family TadE-like protein [Mycobacteriales bacterium]|nr:hypothetical protein [Frankia sp.]